MKKYQRETFVINSKLALKLSVFFLLMALIIWIFKIYSHLVLISIGCSATFICIFLSAVLVEKRFYLWGKDGLYFSKFNFSPYRVCGYNEMKYAVISNASGKLRYGSYLMKYKKRQGDVENKGVFPYLTLFDKEFYANRLTSRMTCLEVSGLATKDHAVDVGICGSDSLKILLESSNVRVYILEDVYLRFKSDFDAIVNDDKFRVFIVSSQGNARQMS